MFKNIIEKLFGNNNTVAKATTAAVNFKNCSKCHRVLEAAAFNRHRKRPDGLQCWCRDCMSQSKPIKKRKSYTRMRRIKAGQNIIKLSFDVTPEQRIILDDICRSRKITIGKLMRTIVEMITEEHKTKTNA